MSLHFEGEPGIRDVIEFRRREIFADLEELLPYAELEHVGSSSVPGGYTSGDVDVQVRVEKARFAEADKELAGKFEREEGGGKELGLFKHEGRGVRLLLTPTDGERDVGHKHREYLRDQPLQRERYDAIKRKFNGSDDPTAYQAAKDAFWRAWSETSGA